MVIFLHSHLIFLKTFFQDRDHEYTELLHFFLHIYEKEIIRQNLP
jgi:hypothetical protein